MNRRQFLTASGLGLGLAPLSGCSFIPHHFGTYRFRLTIEVDTPEGVKSGSSVMEVSYGVTGENIGVGPRSYSNLTGEAVFVDLGGGKNIVAIHTMGATGSGGKYVASVPYVATLGEEGFQELEKGRRLEGGGDLAPPWVPTLVTFFNPVDEKTAKVVYATEIERMPAFDSKGQVVRERLGKPIVSVDEIEATFGPGYRFRRARVDIVRRGLWPLNAMGILGEPLTVGIEKRLPWIGEYRKRGLFYSVTSQPGKFTPNVPYFIAGF